MNLANESASQELLQVNEREKNGYEYQLHDPKQKNKRYCLSFKGKIMIFFNFMAI
jgi:hypothetical protein